MVHGLYTPKPAANISAAGFGIKGGLAQGFRLITAIGASGATPVMDYGPGAVYSLLASSISASLRWYKPVFVLVSNHLKREVLFF